MVLAMDRCECNPSPETAARRKAEAEERARRLQESDQKVRDVILKHLEAMKEDLGQFEHTTHGAILVGDIREVGRELERVYDNPTAFRLSTFVQAIMAMTRAAKKP